MSKAIMLKKPERIRTTLENPLVPDTKYFIGNITSDLDAYLPNNAELGSEILIVYNVAVLLESSTVYRINLHGSVKGYIPYSFDSRVEASLLWDGSNWSVVSTIMAR